jgi:hypothetical protein
MSMKMRSSTVQNAAASTALTTPTYAGRPFRLLKVWQTFFGGAADAAQMAITVPGRDGSWSARVNVEHGALSAGPPFGHYWDLSPGIMIDPSQANLVTGDLLTVTGTAAAAPTGQRISAIFMED